MAPEIVKGEPRGAKADVWSSCCMFLHMLSGCQPWTRYYTCRLYLKVYLTATYEGATPSCFLAWVKSTVHWVHIELSLFMSWLQIANDPPPLREIPSNCSPLTSEVIKLGLQKDPAKRASASDLKEKTARALKKGNSLHRCLILVGTNLHLYVEQSMARVQDKMH